MWQPESNRSARGVRTADGLRRLRILRTPDERDRSGEEASAGWQSFAREVDRARRHERPLALGAVPLGQTPRYGLRRELLTIAGAAVRSIDVLWLDRDNLFVALPETDRAQAARVLARLTLRVRPEAANAWRLSLFPDDALTVGGLVEQLSFSDEPVLALHEAGS
jgi:hypothetical protein